MQKASSVEERRSVEELISLKELQSLIRYFSKNVYRTRCTISEVTAFEEKCLILFRKDYHFFTIPNANGELCGQYPKNLVVLEYEHKNHADTSRVESIYDKNKLRTLFSQSSFARCRGRFPMPVILYNGKHICRSATLSGGAEMYGRTSMGYLSGTKEVDFRQIDDEEIPVNYSERNDWPLFDKYRGQDIKLLKFLEIESICDLMMERKKVKFGMNVTSSEKVDKEKRYRDFKVMSVPYPGCEFFREYREAGFRAEDLVFQWNQPFVDATLEIPESMQASIPKDWDHYKKWDLVDITRNYLKLFLHIIMEEDSGLLIHCISGWDRTPLFIALTRIVLWAGGFVHVSLGCNEILYLCVAYDWLLFGHNLPDRNSKGEVIFFFCFNYLKYLGTDIFSPSCHLKTSPSEFRLRLSDVSSSFNKVYSEVVSPTELSASLIDSIKSKLGFKEPLVR
ncbi:phosphatidylinositol-3,5-bisphosphate 3-phosphatase MTMR14-like [Antedon mediterranea]|uniref:phosphatidylinositol-3,5-bisphosphate 3-phosphatase MTMR14-like n=1 Tax=Antedon mediterranea TaxID=105859 RepID=UPI003AF43131